DLEAIEQLLNDRNATFTYVSSPDSNESISSPPGSNNNYIIQATPPQQQQFSPQQQTFIIPAAPRNKMCNNRSHPYPLILPKNVKPRQEQQQQQSSQDSDIQIISSTPTPQPPQTIILNPNELHRIQTALSAQQSQSQTFYVPTTSISITTISLNSENLTASTPMSFPPPTPNGKSQEDVDFSRKCEDRKIRNRQAAQLSRERKKAEYDQMKNLISRYENENTELKKENLRLKQRISELEGYFVFPKESKKNIAKAVGVSLMVVM
uniref:BZIP domain-containing protein n=1 Tax=Panagrolaimus sp. ES5 TaxID=591445 RepID=A0AC34GE84_9BILA